MWMTVCVWITVCGRSRVPNTATPHCRCLPAVSMSAPLSPTVSPLSPHCHPLSVTPLSVTPLSAHCLLTVTHCLSPPLSPPLFPHCRPLHPLSPLHTVIPLSPSLSPPPLSPTVPPFPCCLPAVSLLSSAVSQLFTHSGSVVSDSV